MGTDSVSNCAKTSSGGDSRCRLSAPPVIFEGGERWRRGLSAPVSDGGIFTASWPKPRQALRETRGIKSPPAHRQVGEVLLRRPRQGPAVLEERKSRRPFRGRGWHRREVGRGAAAWPQTPQTDAARGEPSPEPCVGMAGAELSHQLHGREEKHYVRGV